MDMNNKAKRGIGEGLRRARRDAGLTQMALALRSGIDRATISLIENSREDPRTDTVRRLAEALNMSPADLWRRPGSPNRAEGISVSHNRTELKPDSKQSGHPSRPGSPNQALLVERKPGDISPKELTYEPTENLKLHPGLEALLSNERERLMLALTDEEEAMLRSIRTRSELPLDKAFFIDVLIAYRRHREQKS